MIEESLFESIVAIRRDIHQNPETEFDVQRTAAIAAKELEACGIKVKTGVGISGVVGDLEVPGATKRIALRADMDALPMEEETELPFRSKVKGKAHMCGHDAHTAILIGTAKALTQKKEALKANIRFLFQPNEEMIPGGAPEMIRAGCLDGVDEIYGLHVWPWLDTGEVGIRPGAMLAQSDFFEIEIKGKGGHAAAPHQTVDPIYIGSQLISWMQSFISRRIDPLHSAVLSVTQFHAGTAYNVIPETATLCGTVRTYSEDARKIITSELRRMVEEGVPALGGTAALKYQEGYPPLVNTQVESEQARQVALSFLDGSQVHFPAESAMFGEDFAYYLQQVPGSFLQLGCRNSEKGFIYPLHHSKFQLDEECMKIGVRLLSEIALRAG